MPYLRQQEFHRLQVTGRNGKRLDTESWECSGCSVIFRFTKSR